MSRIYNGAVVNSLYWRHVKNSKDSSVLQKDIYTAHTHTHTQLEKQCTVSVAERWPCVVLSSLSWCCWSCFDAALFFNVLHYFYSWLVWTFHFIILKILLLSWRFQPIVYVFALVCATYSDAFLNLFCDCESTKSQFVYFNMAVIVWNWIILDHPHAAQILCLRGLSTLTNMWTCLYMLTPSVI